MTLRSATEADLEARVHAAMIAVFPWIDAQDLAHQFSFSIKLGRGTLDIDGRKNLQISGRSDILVFVKGVPLVLMELKREGETLTEEDVRQGLSYARVTTPPTPLVMVSNGQETRIHVSYTGEVWVPTERTEQELARRITAVGQIASSDLNEAVSTLLGSGQGHWVKAFRAVSLGLIEDRTGGWAEPFAPFVRGFLIPRRATKRVAAAFRKGARAVVIHGPPLSGKSNVLRDFYERTQALASIGLLILEPSGHGLFQAIANVLSSELGWKLTADDTREWIRAVSLESNSTLVLAVDGIAPENSALLADLNEIATNRFGTAVRLLVTVDDSALDGVTKKRSGREGNAFGRAAHEIPLLPLDDMEFETAKKALAGNRISITRGGESVLSMREPWILRALVPEDLAELPMEPSQLVVRIPPMIDVESLDKATGAIGEGAEIETALRGAASAILDEYLETRNLMQVLQGISTYAVDKRRLEKEIGDLAIGELREKGFLKLGIDWAERPVWFVRVPLLVARHIAIVLVERMREWGEPDEVAKRLIAISSKLPIGDVICAYAILNCIQTGIDNELSSLLSALFSIAPDSSSPVPGSNFAFVLNQQVVNLKVTENGKFEFSTGGSVFEMELEDEDAIGMILDPGGWLILSQLAGLPLGLGSKSKGELVRLDEFLLLEIGQVNDVLSRPDGGADFKEVPVHDISGHGKVVCHLAGVVEPITWALVKYFIGQGPNASNWIGDAISKNSLPLLNRIHIALSELVGLIGGRGEWAEATLKDRIGPALRKLPLHH